MKHRTVAWICRENRSSAIVNQTSTDPKLIAVSNIEKPAFMINAVHLRKNRSTQSRKGAEKSKKMPISA